MNIAAMRVRVTFQKNTIVSDKYGNHKQTWADYFSCYATAGSNNGVSGTGTGSESTGVVIRSEESIAFTCRWCAALASVTSTGYRILCEGKTYNIIYVNLMGFKHNSIKFSCELEGTS
jgi:head-tail adaptor